MSTAENVKSLEMEQPQEIIDFRMISFSLGGRDYGIDIMDVAEISKIDFITYVPNTAAYVRGVHNLRGDIISIIDLRIMFNLSIEEKNADEPEDVLILRCGERLVGVIVDNVNDVVGVSSERIQPPPPVFADINIRYIRGVVETLDRLFIILDTDLVFGEDIQEAPKALSVETAAGNNATRSSAPVAKAPSSDELDFRFITEGLEAYASFYAGPVNEAWLKKRYSEWSAERKQSGTTVQLQNADDANAFLSTFYSRGRDSLWDAELVQAVSDLLPKTTGATASAWVIGTGEGYESYSLACVMRNAYEGAAISIWAHDSDLLKISLAPTLIVDATSAPEPISKYTVQTKEGSRFSEEIRNAIYFEYHDVTHENTFPPVQVIIARDFLSFLDEASRDSLMHTIQDKLAPGGIVIVGSNERLPESEWNVMESHGVQCYAIR